MEARRILVVDDDLLQTWFLETCLKESGYEVVGRAASGEAAVSLALDRKPDLILMDTVLNGEMDGVEAAKHIRAQLEIPVIFLTASSDPHIVEKAKLSSPFGYLVKPCTASELHGAIEVALHTSNVHRELRESEARYRAVVEDQTDAICRFGGDGILTLANAAYREYFGSDSGHFVCCLPFPADDNQEVWRLLMQRSPQSPVTRLSQEILTLGGTLRLYDWTIRALFDDRGAIREFQAVGRDVTDRERGEQTIRESHEELESRVRGGTADLASINPKLTDTTTSRVILEEALCESDERFRAVVDTVADCVFVKDLNGRYAFATSSGAF